MKDHIDELIARYRDAVFSGQESADKIDRLLELVRLDDPRIVELLIEIAGNSSEYDLARIQALRALESREVELGAREGVAQMISSVLQHDKDDEVRSYAARALAGYTDVRGVLDIASSRVLDPDEDDDVRHNAFFAIERSVGTPEAIAAMERCREDAEFSEGASRVLARWTQTG